MMAGGRRYAPRIAVLGGGTGLSSMLRGLKSQSENITAIVTVTDDGGGSGVLRRELNMPPPGDIRNCIQALANAEPAMQEMMNYRFHDGSYAGQSLGNLLLAALYDMSPSFDAAVARLSQVLAITGRVLPVTNENVALVARFSDNTEVRGETAITEYKRRSGAAIRRVRLDPSPVPALPAALEAVEAADMIVLGPGSLYSSVIPNLLTEGLAEAVCRSSAVKVCVMNIMTQPGETEGYTAADHARALLDHGGEGLFRYVLVNDRPVPEEIARTYARQNAVPVTAEAEPLRALGAEPVFAPLAAWNGGLVRHDPGDLARALMALYYARAQTRRA